MFCLNRFQWRDATAGPYWLRWFRCQVISRTQAVPRPTREAAITRESASHLAMHKVVFTTATEVLAAIATMAVIWFSTRPVKPQPQAWMESSRLTVEQSADGDRFGSAVAIDGNTLLIGACTNDAAGPNSGATYLFQLSERNRQLELGRGDREPLGAFGCSVAVSGPTALVGMPADGCEPPGIGAAFVYEQDSGGHWNRTARLLPSDTRTGGEFGICVALHEEIALVTGRGADGRGQVYVFQQVDSGAWREVAKLRGTSGRTLDFGLSIATDGRRVAVGAPLGGVDIPAVYLFEPDAAGTWRQVDRLTISPAERTTHFGDAVAFAGDDIVVGAPVQSPKGAVHVFRRTDSRTWDPMIQLTPPLGSCDWMFGSAIAYDDQTLAVGAPLAAGGAGAVHVYKRQEAGDWQWTFQHTPGKHTQVRRFGSAVAISGRKLLVGAPLGRGASATSGAAYLFSLASFEPLSRPSQPPP